MKGISLISGVIFLSLVLVSITVIYMAAVPAINNMKVSSSVSKWKGSMGTLDAKIQEIASEGEGSRRTLTFGIDSGEMTINGSSDRISWDMETDSTAVSPRSLSQSGRVWVGSGLSASASETSYSGISAYLLENGHLKVYIRKLGNSSSYVPYQASGLVLAVYSKDAGTWANETGLVDIYADNAPSSGEGNGYTELERSGSQLPYGKVKAYLQSNSTLNYYIYFTLESSADFLVLGAST